MSDAETQLDGFFARFDGPLAALGRDARARLSARLPGLGEVVYMYERQGALVISYSPTAKGYDAVCSLSVRKDGVKLYFGQGALLAKSAPAGLLQGRGGNVRYVALDSARDVDGEGVQALIAAALTLGDVRLDASAPASVTSRADSQRQRARRSVDVTKPRRAARAGSRRARP